MGSVNTSQTRHAEYCPSAPLIRFAMDMLCWITAGEPLQSRINDWKCHCFIQTRQHRSSGGKQVSDRLLSQDAPSQGRLRIFLDVLSTLLYIIISLTHELWRRVQTTTGFRAHMRPETGICVFSWREVVPFVAQDPLDRFWRVFHEWTGLFLGIVPRPTFIAEKPVSRTDVKYVLPEPWSWCDHVSMHMAFVLTVLKPLWRKNSITVLHFNAL